MWFLYWWNLRFIIDHVILLLMKFTSSLIMRFFYWCLSYHWLCDSFTVLMKFILYQITDYVTNIYCNSALILWVSLVLPHLILAPLNLSLIVYLFCFRITFEQSFNLFFRLQDSVNKLIIIKVIAFTIRNMPPPLS